MPNCHKEIKTGAGFCCCCYECKICPVHFSASSDTCIHILFYIKTSGWEITFDEEIMEADGKPRVGRYKQDGSQGYLNKRELRMIKKI